MKELEKQTHCFMTNEKNQEANILSRTRERNIYIMIIN